MPKVVKHSEIEIYHILYLVGIIILLLGLYNIYLLSIKSEIINNSNSEKFIPVECINLEGEQKISCMVKNSDCSDDICHKNKAVVNLNESECFEIVDESMRVGCSAQVKMDSILQSTVISDDIDLCLNFEDEVVITACKNNYWYVKAVNGNDKSYCLNIESEEVKNECQNR